MNISTVIKIEFCIMSEHKVQPGYDLNSIGSRGNIIDWNRLLKKSANLNPLFTSGSSPKIHAPLVEPKKKMYSTILLLLTLMDFFIHVDPGYRGIFHNVNVLCDSDLDQNYGDYSTHRESYHGFLLWDPDHLGKSNSCFFRLLELKASIQ